MDDNNIQENYDGDDTAGSTTPASSSRRLTANATCGSPPCGVGVRSALHFTYCSCTMACANTVFRMDGISSSRGPGCGLAWAWTNAVLVAAVREDGQRIR